MPKRERIIRVFIAAPDEVQQLVKAVYEIAEQINTAHGKPLGVRLDLVNWRRDVVPGLGSDPQAVINAQIGDDYQVFMGILWTRFGKATPRAGSGTEEEFNRAYSRWLENAGSVSVMMYFSDLPERPSKVDPQQLAAVRNFCSRIQDRGIYCQFKTSREFRKLVYDHLSSHVHRWSKATETTTWRRHGPTAHAPRQVVLCRERIPFLHGQRADFFKTELPQRCERFKLAVEEPHQPYWRAGFVLARTDDLKDARADLTITRDFLFHIGRGSSAAPTEYTKLHYQAYSKDQPLTHTTPFRAPPGRVEIDVSINRDGHRISVSLGDSRFEGEVDLTGHRFLYVLAWADQFGPFKVPVELTLF
jgi:hypothetical protein